MWTTGRILNSKEKLKRKNPKFYEKLENFVLKNSKKLKSVYMIFLWYIPIYIYSFCMNIFFETKGEKFGIQFALGMICMLITVGFILIIDRLCIMFKEEMIYKDVKGKAFLSLYEHEQEIVINVMKKVQEYYPDTWRFIGKDSLFNKDFYKFSIVANKIERFILIDKEYNIIELHNKTMGFKKNVINHIINSVSYFIYYKVPKVAKKIEQSSIEKYDAILASFINLINVANCWYIIQSTQNIFVICLTCLILSVLAFFFSYIAIAVNLTISDRFYKHRNIDLNLELTNREKIRIKGYIRRIAKETGEYEANLVFTHKEEKDDVCYAVLCDNEEIQMTYLVYEDGEFLLGC